jgi:hypothetical protein
MGTSSAQQNANDPRQCWLNGVNADSANSQD